METALFTIPIGNEELKIYQNAYTGLFYGITADGKHTPVDYAHVKTRTTSQERLKYWRNRYGYTQAKLAKLIHVSSPTVIMMWENGLRHPLRRYRELLNTELNYDIFPD
jgi:DNA-binding XRE family transcriptional regulator